MKFFSYKGNRNRKRIISAMLVASFMATLPLSSSNQRVNLVSGQIEAFATTTSSSNGFDQSKLDDAKQKKKDAEKKLSETKNNITGVKNNQTNVKNQITNNTANLETIKRELEQTKTDIENKQAEIDQTNQDLIAAQEEVDRQYESMKLRIQFMYENNADESLLTALLESDGLADMLVRVEYITDVYKTDRELMDAYELALQTVEEKAALLASQMDDLVALQSSYEARQTELENAIVALQGQSAEYASQLAALNTLKSQINTEIANWAEIIRQQEALAAGQDPNNYAGGGSGKGGLGSAAYLKDDSYNPDYKTSVSPYSLISFALQYVGNPYVWGGNSLTNGCDCSGFVHLVFQNFGISTPRYSQSFLTSGQPVSYNNMKKGDVVVYPGHVAIYLGNGCIVEAQSTKAGITSNRSVNCHTITGIRRLL